MLKIHFESALDDSKCACGYLVSADICNIDTDKLKYFLEYELISNGYTVHP